jgi:hypothetical protein
VPPSNQRRDHRSIKNDLPDESEGRRESGGNIPIFIPKIFGNWHYTPLNVGSRVCNMSVLDANTI